MKYLHLDSQFQPFGKPINFESFTFNGGEPHIRIEEALEKNETVLITARIRSFNDLGLVLIANDAIKRLGIKSVNLFMPYFPAARQDRLMTNGEALTVKVYAQIINQADFNNVYIFDPHSEVTPALLNNVQVIDNHSFIDEVIKTCRPDYLVSPDGGALKKVYKLSETLGGITVIECSKQRDVKTGRLTGFKVYSDDLNGKSCLIVDDICDGGGTFNGLAEALKIKNAGELFLAVSHGIFSQGFDDLNKNFDQIFSTDSFSFIEDQRLNVIELNKLINL